MTSTFAVTVGAGSLSSLVQRDIVIPHAWTAEGVTVELQFTGAHLLHLAVAACVRNDLYREAARTGLDLRGVKVSANGGFDRETWSSTGISYHVEIDTDASDAAKAELIRLVDELAEIPRALRHQSAVRRGEQPQ